MTIQDFKNKYGLSGLHSQPNGYMDYEDKTEEVFKDIDAILKKQKKDLLNKLDKGFVTDLLWKLKYSEIAVEECVDKIKSLINKQ